MSERGAAMIWACALLVAVTALSSVLLTRDETMRREARRDARELEIRYVLEGGLAHARHALARDAAYGGESLSIGKTALDIAAKVRPGGGWTVSVRAKPAGRRLDASLLPTPGLPRIERVE